MEWLMAGFFFLDDKVFLFCRKLAHWFQRMTGVTSYLLAKNCVILVLFVWVLNAINFFWPFLFVPTDLMNMLAISLVVWLHFGNFVQTIRSLSNLHDLLYTAGESFFVSRFRKINASDESPDVASILRISLLSMQVATYFGFFISSKKSTFLFFDLIESSLLLWLVAFWYFVSISPLPPGTTKVGEWIKGFRLGGRKLASQKG